MGTPIPGTLLSSKISPGDTDATFPTHEDVYGKGGFMCVSNTSELASIPIDRQKLGMVVYVNSTGLYYALSGTSSPLTTYQMFSEKVWKAQSSFTLGYDGVPQVSNSFIVSGGNIKVYGVDKSGLPIATLVANDTDGQSIFDLRSESRTANYNLSIAASGLAHFLKFFGGRDGDDQPFIVVKQGEPLRFATFPNFYNNPTDFREYMRIGRNGNVGIAINNPTVAGQFNNDPIERLTVNGNISARGNVYLGGTGRIFYPATAIAPINTTTPVAWIDITVGTIGYKMPLYQ